MKVRAALILALVLAVVLLTPRAAGAQPAVLPPVNLVVTLEVHDQHAWLGMQHEILTTPQESPKNLVVTISARAGSSR